MPAETKYIARRSGPFAALMQATELAGFRLDPLPPGSLRDAYFDTAAGDLLRQGYALRVREQGRTALAQLRVLRGEVAGAPGEADAALVPPVAGPTLPLLPDGPLRDAVDWLAGEAPLRALLRLRQYRSARVAYDGARLVGILSLDVVGYELPAGLHVANEVEVELAETGTEADLHRLDPVLRARGLEPTARSKFERGVLRLQRGPDDPLLLLPDERVALDALLEASDPAVRRRARVVLLASRGYRDETVSAKAGLSPSRVRHWVQRFREGRLDALGAPETPLETLAASGEGPDREAAAGARRRPFRISEVVTGGTPTPALFRAEHFAPEPSDEAPPEASFVVEREREEPPPPAPPLTAHGDGSAGGPPAEPFALVRGLPDQEAPSGVLPAPDTAPPDAPEAAPEAPEPSPEQAVAATAETASGPEPHAEAHAGEPPLPDDVETLDDLLNLFEASPVRTPRLSGERPATGPAPELGEDVAGEPAEARPGEAERTPAFMRLEAAERTGGPADVPAPTSAEPETATAPAPAVPVRPRFRPADPILHAGARVLRYQHARFADAAGRLGDAAAPADVRRALLAAHRVRLALETFEEFLPAQPVRRLHAGLAGVVRALDAVADLDGVAARLDAARGGASKRNWSSESRPAM